MDRLPRLPALGELSPLGELYLSVQCPRGAVAGGDVIVGELVRDDGGANVVRTGRVGPRGFAVSVVSTGGSRVSKMDFVERCDRMDDGRLLFPPVKFPYMSVSLKIEGVRELVGEFSE